MSVESYEAYLVETLAEHAPWRSTISDDVTSCSCLADERFDRDPDGNRRKDGEAEKAWARHVVDALKAAHAL